MAVRNSRMHHALRGASRRVQRMSHHWRRGARICCQRLDGVCSCPGATEFWCRLGSYLAEKSKVLVQMKGASLCKSLKIKDFPSENMPSYLLSLLQKSAPKERFSVGWTPHPPRSKEAASLAPLRNPDIADVPALAVDHVDDLCLRPAVLLAKPPDEVGAGVHFNSHNSR